MTYVFPPEFRPLPLTVEGRLRAGVFLRFPTPNLKATEKPGSYQIRLDTRMQSTLCWQIVEIGFYEFLGTFRSYSGKMVLAQFPERPPARMEFRAGRPRISPRFGVRR